LPRYAQGMDVDLAHLAARVRASLDTYVAPDRHAAAVGEALPPEWFETGLAEMQASLVSPYWIQMRDLDPTSGKLVILRVAVVADAGDGSLVAFDPVAEGEFVVAALDTDPDVARGIDAVSCGFRGDVVECFLSR